MEKRTFLDAELADLCEELAVTLEAGIPVGEGFLLLAGQERDGGRRAVLHGIYERIDRGEPADEAMDAAGAFPAYLVRMIGLGAATGSLDRVLRALGAYWKSRVRRREIVRTAVSYPLLLLAVVLVVFCVFLTDVLPVFDGVYAQMGATMAAPARALLGAGNGLRAVRAPLLVLLALAAAGAFAVWARPAWRAKAVHLLEKKTAQTRMGVRLARAQFAAALSLAYTAVADFGSALERREAARVLEKSLRRAAVSCYALEGRYPQDLDALLEKGGVTYDKTRFSVFYDIFADNILPDITVLER